MVFVIFTIIVVFSFLSFNGNEISKGRRIKLEDLINTEYQSTDGNYYVNFMAEDMLYLKSYIKETEESISSTKSFTLNDGYIETIDLEQFVLVSKNKLVYLDENVVLYLKIE